MVKFIIVGLMLVLVTRSETAVSSPLDCELIRDPDQRNYCRAISKRNRSYCEFIKNRDLRYRCRAEVR